jgi:hypothetical protein
MDAVAPKTEAPSVRPEEMDLLAITLRKRGRSRRAAPSRPRDEITRAERAAITTLAETLQRLATELPEESRLADEFSRIARSIDVAGVLGIWNLDAIALDQRPVETAT